MSAIPTLAVSNSSVSAPLSAAEVLKRRQAQIKEDAIDELTQIAVRMAALAAEAEALSQLDIYTAHQREALRQFSINTDTSVGALAWVPTPVYSRLVVPTPALQAVG